MKEIWKDIPGYEGLYQVSNLGEVLTLSDRWGNKRLLKKLISNDGYYVINLYKNKNPKKFKIHQLIAMAFLDHIPNGHQIVVNHIDNNQLNNHVNNLELVSQRYNSSCHKTDVGISWNEERKKWRSQIIINRKDMFLGNFIDKQEALNMYQKALANTHLYNGDAKEFRRLLNEIK